MATRSPAKESKSLRTRLARTYNRLYAEILFQRGIKYFGTSLTSYQDFDAYLTHAAFHRLKGLPLPTRLGRRGCLPWFADIREAQRMARRGSLVDADTFWNSLLTGFPESFFGNPVNIVQSLTAGSERSGTGQADFLIMDIQSLNNLLKDSLSEDFLLNPDRLNDEGLAALAYWACQFSENRTDAPNPGKQIRTVIRAYRAEPDHPKFKEEIILTGALLDQKPVWLTEFRKSSGEALYRIALVGFQNPATFPNPRLAGQVAREFELFMMQQNKLRKDLCCDFIGSIDLQAAMMGQSLFRRLVAEKISELRKLEPKTFDALYQETIAYRYPIFRRVEIVTTADIIREVLHRSGKRLARYANRNR